MIDSKHLPIVLPEVEKYLPTEDGQPPLGNAKVWAWDTKSNKVVSSDLVIPNESEGSQTIFPLELNTMPGWAGSSWYWLRYMDAQSDLAFASAEAIQYWESVDLYIGGSEHATGHLLYSRFWNKFLKDRGYITAEEPFKKLINQGMILGNSAFVYRISASFDSDIINSIDGIEDIMEPRNIFISKKYVDSIQEYKNEVNKMNVKGVHFSDVEKPYELLEVERIFFQNLVKLNPNSKAVKELGNYHFDVFKQDLHVDLSCINDVTNELDIENFKAHPLYSDYKDAEFILDNGELYDANSSPLGRSGGAYIVGREVEKM